MATAFLRKPKLVTNCRHFMSSGGPNYNHYNHNYNYNYNLIHNHGVNSGAKQQHYQQQYVKHYSRFSNLFRKSGKDVEVPSPFIFGSPVSGFSSSSSNSLSKSISKAFSKNGFVEWYLGMINSRPVLTKSVTCCLIYIAADLTSQTIALESSEPYDFIRTLRMAGYGLVCLGPTLHYWFNFIARILPGRDLLTTVKKMTLGQTVYGPIMTVTFFSLNAALQGEDGKEIVLRLKRDLLPTMLNGVMYWPLCDFITFRFVPVHLQPLVSNGFSYIWTVYMTYMANLEKASN